MQVTGGGAFIVIWVLMMIGGLVGWIIALVAFWRLMSAHESIAWRLMNIESIASSIKLIAESTKEVQKGKV